MKKEVRGKLLLLGILSSISLLFTVIIYYSGFDKPVENYFHYENEGFFNLIMNYITLLGGREGIMVISLFIVSFLLIKKMYNYILFYLVSVAGATLFNYELKNLFQRVRPEVYGSEFAFPSGHTMASTVVFGALALLLWPKNKKLAIGLLVFPLLIGFSRIYLDVHWLSDIFGGFFFATLWLAITFYLFYGWKK